MKCVLLLSVVFLLSFFSDSNGYQLDIPLAVNGSVNLTSNPCNPNATYVTKLVNQKYEIRFLDHNPSLIIYPLSDGELQWDECLIVDIQAWREKGSPILQRCEVSLSRFGTYAWECPDSLTGYSSLKELNWSYIKNETTITWSANFKDEGGSIEIYYELITNDANKTFHNPNNTGSRTLQFLKDDLKFTFSVINYTLQYANPERLLDEFYLFELYLGFLTTNPVKVFQVPGSHARSAFIPSRILRALENGESFVPYDVDSPIILFYMQREDGSFNISVDMATFSISHPQTTSKFLANLLNRTDLLGFDLLDASAKDFFYYDDAVVGQSFLFSFAMSVNEPQTVYYDPNIGLLLSNNYVSDGSDDGIDSSDEKDLVIGLVVGLIGGSILIIIVVGVISFVVFKKQKQIKGMISL